MVFLFRLISYLPLPWLHALGGLIGRLVYLLSSTYRRNLRANVAQAGIDLQLCAQIAAETGKQMLELARIWMYPLDVAVRQVVDVRGLALVEAARAEGKGIVFLTPHLGCFEITAQFLSTLGDITVLYRPPKFAAGQELILMGRKRQHLHLAPADLSGVRTLIKALKKGQMVGMLPDQAPKTGEGVWLKFFDRYAYTMTLAARLTETGAVALLTWGERLPGGQGYRIHFQAPMTPLQGGTVERAQQINHEIETLIRSCPSQYLWGYNRYKRPAGAEPPPAT